jgi:hypothetical protein
VLPALLAAQAPPSTGVGIRGTVDVVWTTT